MFLLFQYKAMLISLSTHLLLLMFEILVADNLETQRHLWILVRIITAWYEQSVWLISCTPLSPTRKSCRLILGLTVVLTIRNWYWEREQGRV